MNRTDIDTPALLVEVSVLRRNIERMQKTADAFGVRLRPHTKTHKSPAIMRLQTDMGASGITVAKLGEAEVMVEAGCDDILIANQVVGALKLSRLAELTARAQVAILVDSIAGVEMLERSCRERGFRVRVMLEIDTGKGRCGLRELDEILSVAGAAAEAGHVDLVGVETHEGHVPGGAADAAELEERARRAGRRLVEIAEALRDRGHRIDEVSVGSTPAAPYTAAVGGVTEMRPGTYVFNDVNQMGLGQATADDCALSILSTVISRPAPDRAVLDAGSKSLFAEPARYGFALPDYEGYGYIREAPTCRIESLSEEHAVVRVAAGSPFPRIGERVEVIPNHVCPAVNLHEEFYIMEGDEVRDVWPIAARGKVR